MSKPDGSYMVQSDGAAHEGQWKVGVVRDGQVYLQNAFASRPVRHIAKWGNECDTSDADRALLVEFGVDL